MRREKRKNPSLQVAEVGSPPPKRGTADRPALAILKTIWIYYRRTYGRTVH